MKTIRHRGKLNPNFQWHAGTQSIKGTRYFLVVLGMSLLVGFSARAQTVLYQQNFNSPSGGNGDIYFNVASIYDGITDGTGTGASFAGNSFLNGQIVTSTPGIASAQGGSGYFLFNNTAGGGTYTSGMEIWGNQTGISVTANTSYTFSFYMANDNNVNNASIQPIIDGVALSSGVTPTTVGTWQQFSFTWNSGSNTTANLELTDLATNPTGNDFGIDTITFTGPSPLPELPVGVLLALGLGVIGLMQLARRVRFA